MCSTINTIESCMDIPDCMTEKEMRTAKVDNEHIGILAELVLHGWPSTKAEVWKKLQPYWSFRDDISVID